MKNLITQAKRNMIDKLCHKFNIINYTINADGTIDTTGDVTIADTRHKTLPLKFNIVGGDFRCPRNYLTTLDGCPKEVGGDFCCELNEIYSLEFSPKKVGGNFNCSYNSLLSLKGIDCEINGDFSCTRNYITSFLWLPTKVGGKYKLESNDLPNEYYEIVEDVIAYNTEYKRTFYRYQNYYDVWSPNFNKENAITLIDDIKDGLR